MTSITGATTPRRLDGPSTPQPLPGHGDVPSAPDAPRVPRNWHPMGEGLALGGAALTAAALTIGGKGMLPAKAMGLVAGIGLGTTFAGAMYELTGPDPKPSPGTVSANEVLKPLAIPTMVAAGAATVVMGITAAVASDYAYRHTTSLPLLGHTLAAGLITAAAGAALVGVGSLIEKAREN